MLRWNPDYDSEKIRSLRDRYQLSQTVLASLLNTSPSAVRQWELGDMHRFIHRHQAPRLQDACR